jgi:hypothetical protein
MHPHRPHSSLGISNNSSTSLKAIPSNNTSLNHMQRRINLLNIPKRPTILLRVSNNNSTSNSQVLSQIAARSNKLPKLRGAFVDHPLHPPPIRMTHSALYMYGIVSGKFPRRCNSIINNS